MRTYRIEIWNKDNNLPNLVQTNTNLSVEVCSTGRMRHQSCPINGITPTRHRCGPVSVEELQRHAAAGRLQPHDLVWKDGMIQWVPAITVPEITTGTHRTQRRGETPSQSGPDYRRDRPQKSFAEDEEPRPRCRPAHTDPRHEHQCQGCLWSGHRRRRVAVTDWGGGHPDSAGGAAQRQRTAQDAAQPSLVPRCWLTHPLHPRWAGPSAVRKSCFTNPGAGRKERLADTIRERRSGPVLDSGPRSHRCEFLRSSTSPPSSWLSKAWRASAIRRSHPDAAGEPFLSRGNLQHEPGYQRQQRHQVGPELTEAIQPQRSQGMADEWYYTSAGQQAGPVSDGELRQGRRRVACSPATWYGGRDAAMGPATSVPGLLPERRARRARGNATPSRRRPTAALPSGAVGTGSGRNTIVARITTRRRKNRLPAAVGASPRASAPGPRWPLVWASAVACCC